MSKKMKKAKKALPREQIQLGGGVQDMRELLAGGNQLLVDATTIVSSVKSLLQRISTDGVAVSISGGVLIIKPASHAS